jgi:fibronectin type 3 domain-containing protein
VAGYKVYRGTVSGGPYTAVTTNLNVPTSFTDTNVTSGTTYYYVVTAVDAIGDESVYSEEVSATVP